MATRWTGWTVGRVAIIALVLAVSCGAAVSTAEARSGYCARSGDFCMATRVNSANNGVAELRIAFPLKYKLCVTDPTGDEYCSKFKTRSYRGIYRNVIVYRADYRGTHYVRWYDGSHQFGRTLSFYIE